MIINDVTIGADVYHYCLIHHINNEIVIDFAHSMSSLVNKFKTDCNVHTIRTSERLFNCSKALVFFKNVVLEFFLTTDFNNYYFYWVFRPNFRHKILLDKN